MTKRSATELKKMELTIRQVFDEGCAAWNRGDLDGYLASYWDSGETLWVSGGSLVRGKDAIASAYKTRFSPSQGMGKLTVTNLQIDVLTPEDAIAFGRWKLVCNDQASNGFFTVQLRKIEGTWLFVLDHSSAD